VVVPIEGVFIVGRALGVVVLGEPMTWHKLQASVIGVVLISL
jgi:hypothetical protein